MGQAGLEVSHENLTKDLNFVVKDGEVFEEGGDNFDFDEKREEKFVYNINSNDVEELRNIIRKLEKGRDDMEERLRKQCKRYQERIISLEREVQQVSNNTVRFTHERIKKLQSQKQHLEKQIVVMSEQNKPKEDVQKLSYHRRRLDSEIRRSRIESIQSTRSRSKRGQIIKEFFFTEKSYVDSLILLKNEYLRPLSQNKIISPKIFESLVIFKDFETIFRVNQKFMSRLEQTVFLQKRDEALVDLVIEFCDSFKLYAEYIKRFAQCQKIFNEQLRKNKRLVRFLDATSSNLKEKMENTETEGEKGGKDVNMSGLLITPIQRLPRYLLLLKDLLKNTKENSKQYQKLLDVTNKLEGTIHYCNQKSKNYEDTLKLIELSKKLDITLIQKTLIVEQQVMRVNRTGTLRPCLLYLFDDVLVIHQVKGNVLLNSLKGGLGLGNLKIRREGGTMKVGMAGKANNVPIIAGNKQWNISFLDRFGKAEGGLKGIGRIKKGSAVVTNKDEEAGEIMNRLIEERLMLVLRVEGYKGEMKIIWNRMKEMRMFVNGLNTLRKKSRLCEFRVPLDL